MLQAKDIMTREVITVNEDLPVKELARILSENRISGAPVLDEQGKVVGVVTESDLIDQNKKVHIPTVVAILDSFIFLESPEKMEKDLRKMAGTRVGNIFTRELIAVTPDTPLDEIATLMSEKGVHTLPVMEGENLVGVIGKSDIIRSIYS
ncbi:membrane protein [Desulfolithobacter dissulfuricans]|uniref:Membrane protein n=1 Tax=Desulfolithobacter dissulfuricans TaxID=2795293 RepID=A0A915U0B4_9BACT|nr:CBS domain-containing protein [Desulfolithobacter dissulfuricans]BCO09121.1 membrane protein [Desulfolithobacter dissulfuricans]